MPFSFFTDPNQLGPEPAHASYGAKSNTKYQVSSGFTSRGPNVNPGAYAITNGRIAVCWAYGSDSSSFDKRIVNVILKPDDQPNGNVPFVKYYIYKGILATSYFDIDGNNDPLKMTPTDERLKLKPITGSSLPLLTRINDARDAMIASPVAGAGTPELLNEDHLGFARTNGENSSAAALVGTLDRIFNNNWVEDPGVLGNTPELPTVNEGERIGSFLSSNLEIGLNGRKGEFSLEIVLDRVGYNSDFSIAAGNASGSNGIGYTGVYGANYHIVTLESVLGGTGNISPNEGSFNRAQKEQVLNFMDPCAFYGAFANGGMPDLNIPSDTGAPFPIRNAWTDQVRANLIYQNILNAPGNDASGAAITNSHIFSNRNTIYIDIRDKYNNTFDWVRDKSISYKRENLKIGFNGNTMNDRGIDYHGDEDDAAKNFSISKKWPILAIEIDDTVDINSNPQPGEFIHGYPFNQLNPTPVVGTNPSGFITIDLGFRRPYDGFDAVTIYVENAINIAPALAARSTGEGFYRVPDNSFEWADPIPILSPNYNADPNNFSVPLANYIRIVHIQQYYDFYEGVDPCETEPFASNDANYQSIIDSNFYSINDTGQYGSDQDNDYPRPLEIYPQEYADFLWPVDTSLTWPGWNDDKIRSTMYSEKVYVNNYPHGGTDFMGSIGIARDADSSVAGVTPKVTLFAYNTIPSNNRIGLIDREFSELSTPYQFSDNSSYLQNVGRNILDFGFERVTVNSSVGAISIDNLFVRTIQEINLELASANPGLINVEDVVFFTIDRADYDAILGLWSAYQAANTWVKPIKAWWSFEPIESGQLPGGQPGQFIRYRIKIKFLNRTNGSAPCKLLEFLPLSGGQQFTTAKIKPITDLGGIASSISASGGGFSIVNQGGVDVINCLIYFIQGSSITYSEFLTYKNYAERNIKQVWSNIEGQPNAPLLPVGIPNDPAAYSNLGLTAQVNSETGGLSNQRTDAISAWNIQVAEGGPHNLRNLRSNEVAFVIERSMFADTGIGDLMRRDRSFVIPAIRDTITGGVVTNHSSNPRIGQLVFNGQAQSLFNNCSNPYLDDNTAAHEFGHMLGLTDRYTYSVNVNATNDVVRTTGAARNYYLPDSFDINYTQDYRWICNLMAVGANKIPNADESAAGPFPTSNFDNLHDDFWTLTGPYASNSNAQYSNIAHGNTFITPKQWQIIKSFSTDSTQFEDNEFVNPEFRLQPYAFFTPDGTNWPYGSFVGYDANPAPDGRAVSDYGFQDTGTVGEHRMAQRVAAAGAPTPSPILGYYWPFDTNNSHPLVTSNAATDTKLMFNIRIGNDAQLLFQTINGLDIFGNPVMIAVNHPSANDLVNVWPLFFNLANPVHATFNSIGTSDPAGVGRTIWNKITDRGVLSIVEQYQYPAGSSATMLMHTFNLRTTYDNRDEIIELLVFGSV